MKGRLLYKLKVGGTNERGGWLDEVVGATNVGRLATQTYANIFLHTTISPTRPFALFAALHCPNTTTHDHPWTQLCTYFVVSVYLGEGSVNDDLLSSGTHSTILGIL